VDARTPDAGGREDRAGNARFVRGNHAGEAASRAGVPRLPRHSAARQGYGVARLDAACRRGNDIGARSYGSIASILKHGLDRAYREGQPPEGPPIRHGNIRGRGYYH